jgi:sporulation protein YlmC with PRC-barrel domain
MRKELALGCAVFVLAGQVLAQDPVREQQEQTELRADWIIGSTVTTPDGETIGTVDDLLLDKEDGNVTGAIVSVGGFLGFGAKQVAVEWNELEENYDGTELVLSMTRQQAEDAPAFGFRERETPPPPQPATGTGTGTATQPPPE